jgi:hypothetical protein
MTTERHAWSTLHPGAPAEQLLPTCACGQELDTCRGSHCPRCGTSIAARAA